MMAQKETAPIAKTANQSKSSTKIYEKELFESISKAHSVPAFLQSYGLDILAYGSAFYIGSNKINPVWLIPPVALLVMKDVWSARRENKKFNEIIDTLRDDDNYLVLADPNELPPWVHNPDIERCSWVNKLLHHFWPFICHIIEALIKSEVEPIVSKTVSGLKIKKALLGSIPPTLSGIKVYDQKVSSSNLMIDAYITYSGDSDFKVSYWGVPGGVENFQLRGPVRISLLLLETIPFVGGVEFSFLGHPELDFVLTGAGSIGFVEEAVRKGVNDVISSFMVYPNKIKKEFFDRQEQVLEDPEGVIRVNIVKAKQLENKDFSLIKENKSDPYAEVSYGSKTFWSTVIDDSSDPEWNLWCEFVKNENDKIYIKVMDKDFPDKDDLIGTCSLNVSDIKKKGKIDSWVQLEGSKGSVQIRAFFLQLSGDVQQAKFPPTDLSFLSSYVLLVLIKSAHNLRLPRGSKTPSPVVQMSVGNETKETEKIEGNDNPMFGESFSFFVNNPDFNKLRVKVIDGEDKSEIGRFSYNLRKLFDRKNLEILDQHFPLLDSASDCTVVASLRLRVIENVF